MEDSINVSDLPEPPPDLGSVPESDPDDNKLCILRLEKWLKREKLEKDLREKLSIPFTKTRKVLSQNFALVYFADPATKERYFEVLRDAGYEVVNSRKAASHKRLIEQDAGAPGDKRHKATLEADAAEDGSAPQARTVDQVVTPWADVPYAEQQQRKRQRVTEVLREMVARVRKECKDNVPSWARIKKQQLPCALLDLIPSPVTSGYRNKMQFTVGLDAERRPCVGFVMGRINETPTVADASDCVHMSPQCRAVLQLFQQLVAASGLGVHDKRIHKGFWRQLTVRTFRSGDASVIVQVDPADVASEARDAVYESLLGLVRIEGVRIESLLLQEYSGISETAPLDCPFRVLHGSEYVHEEMLGLRFRVSPSAFFQVNTPAAELLYGTVRDWIADARKSIGGPVCVLDVCCGTGTIGLTMSAFADRVIGIELDPHAIKDAKFNANLNNLKNTFFLAGKAEDVVSTDEFKLLCHGYNLLAVVDPPRAGLHQSVIKTLRGLKGLTHIVYVSCDPVGLLTNTAPLVRMESKHTRGTPFVPIQATAVDLFPHTPGVEVVALFARQSLAKTQPASSAAEPSTSGAATAPATQQLPASDASDSVAVSTDAPQLPSDAVSDSIESSGPASELPVAAST
eukprot:TRINITY_DN31882_c0_g1_i1.p1 TRINITY_DN31882_c0_g1~~TRINITY_DN31882_c0_g1_i1.p1  ORF type:complete len:629 (-),score=95.71 TRINITY_DN31882_c0_g1_i1:168-2054(-)